MCNITHFTSYKLPIHWCARVTVNHPSDWLSSSVSLTLKIEMEIKIICCIEFCPTMLKPLRIQWETITTQVEWTTGMTDHISVCTFYPHCLFIVQLWEYAWKWITCRWLTPHLIDSSCLCLPNFPGCHTLITSFLPSAYMYHGDWSLSYNDNTYKFTLYEKSQ